LGGIGKNYEMEIVRCAVWGNLGGLRARLQREGRDKSSCEGFGIRANYEGFGIRANYEGFGIRANYEGFGIRANYEGFGIRANYEG
jgi:hypothetical protein